MRLFSLREFSSYVIRHLTSDFRVLTREFFPCLFLTEIHYVEFRYPWYLEKRKIKASFVHHLAIQEFNKIGCFYYVISSFRRRSNGRSCCNPHDVALFKIKLIHHHEVFCCSHRDLGHLCCLCSSGKFFVTFLFDWLFSRTKLIDVATSFCSQSLLESPLSSALKCRSPYPSLLTPRT